MGHVACIGGERNIFRFLVGKLEKKGTLGRPRRKWEFGIGMNLSEICWALLEWIRLAQDRER
jgi:hypothetical protein